MATATRTFRGLPKELFTFLAGLEKDNSKSYWDAHKGIWQKIIQPTVEDLIADLEVDFGPLRTFRPNRDVRFSADKSPYKTWIGITTSDRAVGGVGSFLRIENDGLRVAAGAMAFAPDQVKAFRGALDNAGAAEEFDAIRADLERKGLPVGPGKQAPLQRPPAGFCGDHPRAEQLRWKGAVVIKEYPRSTSTTWMHTPEVTERVRQVWSDATPLVDWIKDHVGTSAIRGGRPR